MTPEGRGAISVVRIWGPGALDLADSVFRPHRGRSLARSRPGRLRVGRIGDGLGDEVVAVVLGGDPPEVEVHCHGGPAPLTLVVEALARAGAEDRRPVAWVRHDARSAVAAEALVDLARAPTVRTAEILLEQEQGALEDEALRLAAQIAEDPERAREGLLALLRRSTVGMRLVTGWRVVLAGRPNVGKSRLLNALAGYDRAIVDPSPGTTRDVVTVRTAVDGWPIELADTAGLRASEDTIESSGIALARARQRDADLVVVVLDRSRPRAEDASEPIVEGTARLVVANKSDLPAAWEPEDPGILTISAQRGDGIDSLISAIACRLVPDPPAPGAGVPFRPRQVRRVEQALRSLEAGDPLSSASHLMALRSGLPRGAGR